VPPSDSNSTKQSLVLLDDGIIGGHEGRVSVRNAATIAAKRRSDATIPWGWIAHTEDEEVEEQQVEEEVEMVDDEEMVAMTDMTEDEEIVESE
jgi:hypothetical protein